MLRFILHVALKKRFAGSVVKKTDDEMTRYVKQTTNIKRRCEFEQQLQQDLDAMNAHMNTEEIRADYYEKMEEIQYDKGRLSDQLNLSFLTDR